MALLLRPVGEARPAGPGSGEPSCAPSPGSCAATSISMASRPVIRPCSTIGDMSTVRLRMRPPRVELRDGERTTLEAGRRELLQAMRILDEPEPGEVTRGHARRSGPSAVVKRGESGVAVAIRFLVRIEAASWPAARPAPARRSSVDQTDPGRARGVILVASVHAASGRARGTTGGAIRSLLRGCEFTSCGWPWRLRRFSRGPFRDEDVGAAPSRHHGCSRTRGSGRRG